MPGLAATAGLMVVELGDAATATWLAVVIVVRVGIGVYFRASIAATRSEVRRLANAGLVTPRE